MRIVDILRDIGYIIGNCYTIIHLFNKILLESKLEIVYDYLSLELKNWKIMKMIYRIEIRLDNNALKPN